MAAQPCQRMRPPVSQDSTTAVLEQFESHSQVTYLLVFYFKMNVVIHWPCCSVQMMYLKIRVLMMQLLPQKMRIDLFILLSIYKL